MCKHLLESKISFRDYFLKKFKNETVYFYCEKCDKFFVEKSRPEIVTDSWGFIYLLCITLNFIAEIVEIKAYISIPVSILLLILLDLLQIFVNWKLLRFEELSKAKGNGNDSLC